MNWGNKITLVFIGFVILVITMVIFSMKQEFHMVEENYYEEEIAYQVVWHYRDGTKKEWKGKDGETYEGDWVEGKAQGKGTYKWKNGDEYTGDWFKCLKHGMGRDDFSSGDSYEGQYQYGKPWGRGTYVW